MYYDDISDNNTKLTLSKHTNTCSWIIKENTPSLDLKLGFYKKGKLFRFLFITVTAK